MAGIGHYARATPDATALVEGRRKLTYAELDARQRALIGALRSDRVKRGDRIAIHGGNRMELLEVTIAALRIGIVPVPIHSLLAPPEIRYLLEDSGARWLFTDRPVESPPDLERVVTF